ESLFRYDDFCKVPHLLPYSAAAARRYATARFRRGSPGGPLLDQPEPPFEHPNHGLQAELRDVEGLAHKIIAAAQARLHPVLEGGHSGDKDDGRLFVEGERPRPRAELEAVHLG